MRESKNTYPLSQRSLSLFKSLVEHFISDGQPVGSRALANDMELSAATIRNVMADLEDMGFLHSPYVSSGRVPTDQGYRLFVDHLLSICDPKNEEIDRITQEIVLEDSCKDILGKTSGMLSDITSLVSVVMLPRMDHSILNKIEFVQLSDKRILVILMMSNNEIQNRIIHTTRSFSASELEQASNYLNTILSGKDLCEVRAEILTELNHVKDNVNKFMREAVEIAKQAIDTDTQKQGGDYVMAGETNLMDLSEWANIDKLKRLFDAFNQKRDILYLLEKSIHAKGVQLFIGKESGYEVLDNCSVVTSPYESEGKVLGAIAIIGPTRMDYERIIPIVDLTAKTLGAALNSEQSPQ